MWRYCSHLSQVNRSKMATVDSYSFGSPFSSACSLMLLSTIDKFNIEDSPTMFCTRAAYPGAVNHCFDCFLGRRCWFCLHFKTWFAPFELHINFGLHLEGKASGRRTYVSCGRTWGRFILIGNRTAIYSISECQKIRSGISARALASISRKPLIATTTCPSKEDCHCITLASSS